jgi:hypothetical protein
MGAGALGESGAPLGDGLEAVFGISPVALLLLGK